MTRQTQLTPLRGGVVGLRHGREHAEQLAKHPGFELTAICDQDDFALGETGERFGVESGHRYHDFAQMLERAPLDVVVIATPVHLHEAMSIQAMERGLHVLIEKPLAQDLETATRIRDAAAQSDTVAQVGFMFRSSPLARKVKSLIEAGEVGNVVVLWSHMFRHPPVAAGDGWRGRIGLFFDCMIHELDGMRHFAGAAFHRVCAFGAPQGATGAKADDHPPETVTACVEFENAVRGSVAFSQLVATHDHTRFGVVGDRGRLEATAAGPDGAGSVTLYSEGGLFHHRIDINGDKATRGHLGFAEQYDFFADSIVNRSPNVSSVDSAVRTQALMTAFDRAMAEDRTVFRREVESDA